VIAVVQVVAMLVVLGAVSSGPAHVPLLVAAGGATTAMMVALAMATAGLTSSPEHAQVTTLPVSLSVIAVASWVGITGTDDLARLKRLLPGGSATEMVINAWNGGVPLLDSLPLLATTLGWVAVAVALAARLFRWEPRR
jgi:ABC-2 type transport system permease protein